MEYIKNCTVAIDLKHIFCKMEDIDTDIIQKAGRGTMVRAKFADMTYMVYRYEGYVIFPK